MAFDVMGMGPETRDGFGFLQELVAHMVCNDQRSYHLPSRDVPIDLSHSSIRVARFDKILQVIERRSLHDGKGWWFCVRDESDGRVWRFVARHNDTGLHVEMEPGTNPS